MIHLARSLTDSIGEFWKAGDNWTRIPLVLILAWPFVLVFIAMWAGPGLLAFIAMFPLLPLIAILLASPVATGVLWGTVEGRGLIRVLVVIATIELIIGLSLAIIPIENARGLVPVFVLVAVILALAPISGLGKMWGGIVITALLLILGSMTAWFYVAPYWPTWWTVIKSANPVPWWGFLLVSTLIALALMGNFTGWKRYGGLVALLLLFFLAWQKLYEGEIVRTVSSAAWAHMPGVGKTHPGVLIPKGLNSSVYILAGRLGSEEVRVPTGMAHYAIIPDREETYGVRYFRPGGRDTTIVRPKGSNNLEIPDHITTFRLVAMESEALPFEVVFSK